MKLLATNVTLTNIFTDIGIVIGPKTFSVTATGDDVIKFSFLTIAVELDINDSKNFQIKAKAIDIADNIEFEFPIETIKKSIVQVEPLIQEFNLDIDATQLFQWQLDTTIDAIQLQVRVDTLGATAGIVTSLRYNLGYRQ